MFRVMLFMLRTTQGGNRYMHMTVYVHKSQKKVLKDAQQSGKQFLLHKENIGGFCGFFVLSSIFQSRNCF